MKPSDCTNNDCRLVEEPGYTTAAYYPPIYNKNGVNINPDRNVTTSYVYCEYCKKKWRKEAILGNSTYIELTK